MRVSKILSPILGSAIALTALSGVAYANDNFETNPQEAHETTTKVRQVTYQCQGRKQLVVRYGFNRQNLPTCAEAHVNGKTRFMPINLKHSDHVDTMFGDENNYNIGTNAMTLNNYHKLSLVGVMNPASEFTHKGCKPVKAKRIKG